MSIRASVATGIKWQAVNVVSRLLLSFVVFAVLARLLDVASFGMMGMAAVYISFVGLFAEQGVGVALIQKQGLEEEHIDTAFWFNFGMASTLCLGTLLFSGDVAQCLGEPRLAPILRWSSLGLVLGASASIHACLFAKAMDFRRPAARTLIANLSGGVVGVASAAAGFGVWALVAQQLTSTAAGAAFLWSASSYRPSLRFSIRHLRDLLGVSSSVLGTSILWFASSRLDQIVIGRFLGMSALGLYVIAGKIPEMAKLFTHQPTAEVSLPALSQMQGDYPRLCNAIYRGMELNAIISFGVFVGIAAIAPLVVPLFFGSKWVAASDLCALLAIYALVNALQVFFHPALLASGGAGRYLILNLWHSGGVLLACLVGIRAGTTYLVCGLILNGVIVAIAALKFLRRRIGLSVGGYVRPCFGPAVAATLMFVSVRSVDRMGLEAFGLTTSMVVGVLCGVVVYVVCLFFFVPGAAKRLAAMLLSALDKR